MIRSTAAFIPALLICASARGAGDYVGAAACGGCHRPQYAGQSASGHAQALRRAADHPLAAAFTPATLLRRPPNFRFRFVRTEQGMDVHGDDSRLLIRLPVEWAFGAGTHAVTFVGKASDELYLEHSFSYYSDTKTLDITPKHDGLPAETLHQAMGQAIRIDGALGTIRDCFQCHSTGPVTVSASHQVQISEEGVRCEVCHGPGREHVASGGKRPLQNPGAMSAIELNRFCGRCHRFQDDLATIDWSDPWNARHQPPSLQQSRCFQQSGGKLSCLTCHDPHTALRRNDAAYYNAKCSGCHQQTANHGADCSGCHMPLVAANQHLKFRNHWIGTYREGATLKPVR